MSRVLVTGGAGFIGSHVVDHLIAAGHEPRIYDIRRSPWHGHVDTVIGDVCDVTALTRAMEGCDAVAHLAAAADVGEVAENPVAAENVNARGTCAVLQAAREAKLDRVLYASTIWVYSDVIADRVDEDTLLPAPAHLYTATKLAGELYCRSFAELYGIDSTILRFGIPYGPRARPAAVVPAFMNKALAGEPLTIAGDGSQARRFVYVEDLAEGVVRALDPVAANRTYNLVGDEDVTIRELADTVRDIVGDVEIVHVEGRAADFKGAEVCGRRAADELGWRPQTPFAEGVRRYAGWLAENGHPAPARSHRRLSLPSARLALLVIVGLIAGALAAAMTRTDLLSDPASLIGTLVLLSVPTALIANVDWTRDRRDAVVITATMVGGALIALGWSFEGDLVEIGVHHYVLTLSALSMAAVGQAGARRLLAARA